MFYKWNQWSPHWTVQWQQASRKAWSIGCNAFDNIFWYLGTLADVNCGLSCLDVLSKVATEYAKLADFEFRRRMKFEWTGKIIQILEQRFQFFKKKARNAIEKYQGSEMLTQKWHAFDHCCDAIIKVGGTKSSLDGITEISHDRLKQYYGKCSVQNEQQWAK